jgi:hypothetical protein
MKRRVVRSVTTCLRSLLLSKSIERINYFAVNVGVAANDVKKPWPGVRWRSPIKSFFRWRWLVRLKVLLSNSTILTYYYRASTYVHKVRTKEYSFFTVIRHYSCTVQYVLEQVSEYYRTCTVHVAFVSFGSRFNSIIIILIFIYFYRY